MKIVKVRGIFMSDDPVGVVRKQVGGADADAEKMRKEILNAKDCLNVLGTKYYISSENGDDSADGISPSSSWRTLKKLKEIRNRLKPGDAVLFERGSLFRNWNEAFESKPGANNMIWAVSGVTYGAYGEGEKPAFYGSAQNYAEAEWIFCGKSIWQMSFPLQNAGMVLLDEGKCVGVKKWSLDELEKNDDYFHDEEKGVFYLFSDIGCPSEIYKSIEIGRNPSLFILTQGTHDVVIDNLCFKYAGAHAICGAHYVNDIKITNCEIGWCGGAFFPGNYECGPNGRRTRYGNAIEFGGCSFNILLQNNWVYQIYDAGLTFQSAGHNMTFRNITFKDNLIQYCNYSIEFFMRRSPEKIAAGISKTKGVLENIEFTGNIMQFAGHGVCEQRPDRSDASHICGWITDVGDGFKNVIIKSNIFDLASHAIVRWKCEANKEICVRENTFYMKSDFSDVAMRYGTYGTLNAENQAELEKAVRVFDSSPAKVRWLVN